MEISDELRTQLAEDRRCVLSEIEQIENQVALNCCKYLLSNLQVQASCFSYCSFMAKRPREKLLRAYSCNDYWPSELIPM